jgi:ABC-2 type transport system permease protein
MSLIVVAKKEFADQITSKRFIVILALMLLISAFSFYQGIDGFMRGYRGMNSEVRLSIIQIFGFFGTFGITTSGAILGLLMGFDLITRERESGSLKTLLAHPVFRDQIINGKALGAFAAMCLVVVLTLIIALGILAIKGFIPSLDDLIAIAKFGLVTLAYLFTFFSIALFTSTVAKNSSTSLLVAFGIFILLSVAMPMLGNLVAQAVVGPPPNIGPPPIPHPQVQENPDAKVVEIEKSPEWQEWRQKMEEYQNKRRAVESFFNIISPTTNYRTLISSLSERPVLISFQSKDVTKNLVGFIMLPVVFFVISYIKFLRSEII